MENKLTLKDKSILVTGGTGFVGSHLVELLALENPSQIVIFDRNSQSKRSNLNEVLKRFPKIELLQMNVSNFKGLEKLLKKYNFDVIFHLAALSLFESLKRPKEVVLANIRMATNLLELQRKGLFKTLILISSSEAYGTAKFFPMKENHSLNPTTPYAASKAAADLIALSFYQTFGNDLAIVRPFNQYGPKQNPHLRGIITATIEALLADKRPIVNGTGNQTRDYVFVKDTVRGILEAYKHPSSRGKIINLGSGKMIKMKDLVNKLIKISGKKVAIRFRKARVADVKNHHADIALAKRLLDWQPKINIDDGLKETYNWYKSLSSNDQINKK